MKWLKGTLDSIVEQVYSNYDVCVVDDASTDEGQAQFIEEYCKRYDWSYILRDKHVGAMANQVAAINEICDDDDDVIVIVDGDDRLADPGVLSYLDAVYRKGTVDMTYGSYTPEPPSKTCPMSRDYPHEVVMSGNYRAWTRKHGIMFNHLRTFKYKLFRQMDEDVDFKWPNGEWFEACADTAIMIPALELSRGRWRHLTKKLYVYNSENPISDWRKRADTINKTHEYILGTLKRKV
jgi:glycosyltransferase involved in cell wall biosynthesis